MVFGKGMEDVLTLLELANVQLGELHYLEDQLDESLQESYEVTGRWPTSRKDGSVRVLAGPREKSTLAASETTPDPRQRAGRWAVLRRRALGVLPHHGRQVLFGGIAGLLRYDPQRQVGRASSVFARPSRARRISPWIVLPSVSLKSWSKVDRDTASS